MEAEYIAMMIQSLEKKLQILNRIIRLNEMQKELLEDPNLEPEDFEENINSKGELIEQLELLDSGFEKLYERVREELNQNKQAHKQQIEQMQELIRRITESSNTVRIQEQRNYKQAQMKFASIRRQVKNVRDSQKAVKQYYSSMMKTAEVTSQFYDNKK